MRELFIHKWIKRSLIIFLYLIIVSGIIVAIHWDQIKIATMNDEELLTYCLELNDDELTDFLTSINTTQADRAMNLILSYKVLVAQADDDFTDKNTDTTIEDAVNMLNEVESESSESDSETNNDSNDLADILSDEEIQELIEQGIIVPAED